MFNQEIFPDFHDTNLWSTFDFPWSQSRTTTDESISPDLTSPQNHAACTTDNQQPPRQPTEQRSRRNIVIIKREANPFTKPDFTLPIRSEFWHSEVSEERAFDTYLQWVYSDSTDKRSRDLRNESFRSLLNRRFCREEQISNTQLFRGIGVLLSQRLMTKETRPSSNKRTDAEKSNTHSRTFDGLNCTAMERPDFYFFIGHKVDAWTWYAKGWKVRGRERWLKKNSRGRKIDMVPVQPEQSHIEHMKFNLTNGVTQQSRWTVNEQGQLEVAQLADDDRSQEEDEDSIQSQASAGDDTGQSPRTPTRRGFYNHPGVDVQFDSDSGSDSSGSPEPPSPPPKTTLRRSQSSSDLRARVETPPPSECPRPQKFRNLLGVISESEEEEPPASSSPWWSPARPDLPENLQQASTDSFITREDSARDDVPSLSFRNDVSAEDAIRHSLVRKPRFVEIIDDITNGAQPPSPSTPRLHQSTSAVVSQPENINLEPAVNHSVSTGIKQRLERLGRTLQLDSTSPPRPPSLSLLQTDFTAATNSTDNSLTSPAGGSSPGNGNGQTSSQNTPPSSNASNHNEHWE